MSKIIMDAHKTCAGHTNETKKLVYIKEVNSVAQLFLGGKPLNSYVSNVAGVSKVILTTQTSIERPELNIKPLEIKIT